MPVDGPQYPVNLLLRGRRCLVVGGGAVAGDKVRGLLDAEAVVHVIAPSVSDAIKALDGVTWDERAYRRGEARGYRLVIAATDDPLTNEAVYLDGESAGVWVNAADDPAHCAFTLPARVRRGPLLVTFSTGGHSPALSRWLRRRFEVELGPEYEALLDLLAEERAGHRAAGTPTESLDWQSALDSGMLDLIREGRLAEAREALRACLSSSSG
jgi:precorrin-2 dehydrogenase/sirohydrochlorin ferrochelatase